MGTGGKKFYYSDDECFTIHESSGLTNLQNWGSIKRSVVKNDEYNTIYLLAQEWDYDSWEEIRTLHKSTNNGESFELIHTLTDEMSGDFDLWTSRFESSEIYLQNDNDIYIVDEDDQLAMLGSINTAATGNNLLVGGMNAGSPFLYARIGSDIYYSSNSGINWYWRSTAPSGTFMQNSFNCSNLNPLYVFIGSVDLYRSSSGAQNWQMVNNWWEYYGQEGTKLHADIPEVQLFVTPDGDEIAYISTDGGIYESYDYIQTVNNLSLNGLGVSQYYSTYTTRFEPHRIFAGAQDQGYQRSEIDEGGILDFEQVISGDYGHLVSGDDGASIWCDYPGFVLHYPTAEYGSNGLTWDFVGSNYLWMPPLTEHPDDPDICFIGGGGQGGNHIVQLEAGTNSISHNQLDFNFAATISAMAVSPIDNNYMYALTTEGHFYHSSNAGENWQLTAGFSGPESHYFYGASILPSEITPGLVVGMILNT